MLPSGVEVMYFDFPKFVSSDAFILKLPNAVNEYPTDIVAKAEAIFNKKTAEGRTDTRIPFRPDHGIKMLDDFTHSANPGYPLIGRMRELAYISYIEAGIEYEMNMTKTSIEL